LLGPSNGSPLEPNSAPKRNDTSGSHLQSSAAPAMNQARDPTVLFVCVHYQNASDTCTFLSAIQSQKGSARYRCLVIDNSGDYQLPPDVSPTIAAVIRPKTNLGYFNGAQAAIKELHGTLPDWVVVSNADVTIRDTFLKQLVSARIDAKISVLAPRITSVPDGTELNPHLVGRPSVASMHVRRLFLCNSFLRPLYFGASRVKRSLLRPLLRSVRPRTPTMRPAAIYAAHGCCLVFHRKYFEAGGTLCHPKFLFGEEILVAEGVRKLGQTILFHPALEAQHREHGSTGRDDSRSRIYQAESLKLIVDAFFHLGRPR